jgi:hypothetical protein
MVLFNVGPGREDYPCSGRDVSVPHVSIGATARTSERIFASGNERTAGIMPEWNVTDAGYKFVGTDKLAARKWNSDLMIRRYVRLTLIFIFSARVHEHEPRRQGCVSYYDIRRYQGPSI